MNRALAVKHHRENMPKRPDVVPDSRWGARIWHGLTQKHFNDHLETFGPGVTLYYRSSVRFLFMFAMLSVASSLSMSILVAVHKEDVETAAEVEVEPEEADDTGVELAALDLEAAVENYFPPWLQPVQNTMLGVFDDVSGLEEQVDIGFGFIISAADACLLLGYIDAGSIIFYVLFLRYLSALQNYEIRELEQRNLQVCDFTLMIRNLPAKTSIVAIKKHFEGVAQMANAGSVLPRKRNCQRENGMRPPDGYNSIVAEVSVALHEVGPALLLNFLARTKMQAELHKTELKMMRDFNISSVMEIPKMMRCAQPL